MVEENINKRGAPFGNQYARKHGFYSSVLSEAEQLDFAMAIGVEGLDEEIALLRVKIKSLAQQDPENVKLMMKAVTNLERLVRTKYNFRNEDKGGIKEAVAAVLKDIALPLGIGLSAGFNK